MTVLTLTGTAAHYLISDAHQEQAEFTRLSKDGDWQYSAIKFLKSALDHLDIESEDVPTKSDLKRWFRLLATLRNKTRGHGATKSGNIAGAANFLRQSIDCFCDNCLLFKRPWAYFHKNLSGKYRISPIAGDSTSLEFLKKETGHAFRDGIYIIWGTPRYIPLLKSSPELDDFYYSNGNYSGRRYELLSYQSDNKIDGDSQEFITPPGTLPKSETDGRGELQPRFKCLSNAPDVINDYVERKKLEDDLLKLLLDDKRPIVTLRGKGGIGKTSLALKVLESVYKNDRYFSVVWLSSRDVDLSINGPKPVRPNVVSPEDMSMLYAKLVLSESEIKAKGFNPKSYFEQQINNSDSGPTLFVFDNFETNQNPVEIFNWIDTYIRLPNKVLITTRLRDFKGDYPVDVLGMTDDESRVLVRQTANHLGVSDKLDKEYIEDLLRQSEGHPYVIKILLGDVAKTGQAKNIRHIVAGSDEILIALFERTYTALSPCAQRAFMTLSDWNSSVPRLALEAVLLRSTGERQEVEMGIESLLQYSLAELHTAPTDGQEFIGLPLVASVFGKKKLNISPYKSSIQADVEILQMLGPSRRDDIHLGIASRLERFVAGIAKRIDSGESYDQYSSLLEMICRSYPNAWLLLARWNVETNSAESFDRAHQALTRFLETGPIGISAAEAWRQMAYVCFRKGDTLGEIHSFIERAQLSNIEFFDISNTANRLSQLLRDHDFSLEKEVKQTLAHRLLSVMENRKSEADANDLSRMAWLAIHLGVEEKARQFIKDGLIIDSENFHCKKLSSRLGIQAEI